MHGAAGSRLPARARNQRYQQGHRDIPFRQTQQDDELIFVDNGNQPRQPGLLYVFPDNLGVEPEREPERWIQGLHPGEPRRDIPRTQPIPIPRGRAHGRLSQVRRAALREFQENPLLWDRSAYDSDSDRATVGARHRLEYEEQLRRAQDGMLLKSQRFPCPVP
ncbi:hypothetical protein VUR80DRAFT_1531 [Thermomyces stellatus]